MPSDDKTIDIILSKLDNIDDKTERLNDKVNGLNERFDEKLSDHNDKVEEKIRQIFDKLASVEKSQARINVRCKARKFYSESLQARIEGLEATAKSVKEVTEQNQTNLTLRVNNEWKLFFKMVGKITSSIVIIGSALLFIYQVYLKLKDPSAPMPQMPSLP
jgi:chromosome segregation ATPase